MPFKVTNCFDLIPAYEPILKKLLLQRTGEDTDVRCGEVRGNLLLRSLESLQMPVDILKAGPPCQAVAAADIKIDSVSYLVA